MNFCMALKPRFGFEYRSCKADGADSVDQAIFIMIIELVVFLECFPTFFIIFATEHF
jgi:hypothetical protein